MSRPVVYWYPSAYPPGHSRQGNLPEALSRLRPVAYLGTGPERSGVLPRITVAVLAQSDQAEVTVVTEHLPVWWVRLRRRAPGLVDRIRWRALRQVLDRHGFGSAAFVGAGNDPAFFRACPLRPRILDLMDPRLDGDRPAFDRQLQGVIDASEAAVATAAALADDLARLGRPAALVPNGCRRVAPPPVSSDRFPPASVGYLGTIDQRVDVELLVELVSALPEVSFLFGGRVNADRVAAFAPLEAAANVTYAGVVAAEDTHEFMSALAVGLIPFRTGWVGDRINPVKLSEYAAYGMAVVGSDIAECRASGIVEVADDLAGWVGAVRQARTRPLPIPEALGFAALATWDRRARQLEAVVAGLVGG